MGLSAFAPATHETTLSNACRKVGTKRAECTIGPIISMMSARAHAAIGRLWLLADREVPVAASLSARSLSKSAIAEAIADGFSPSEVDRVRRLALVVSGDGAVVTVASIHGRKGRHYQRRMRRYWKG